LKASPVLARNSPTILVGFFVFIAGLETKRSCNNDKAQALTCVVAAWTRRERAGGLKGGDTRSPT